MVISAIEAFGEAYATLRKAGVAPQAFLEIMNTLLGSPVLSELRARHRGRKVSSRRDLRCGWV